jgi:hypothetical protein
MSRAHYSILLYSFPILIVKKLDNIVRCDSGTYIVRSYTRKCELSNSLPLLGNGYIIIGYRDNI